MLLILSFAKSSDASEPIFAQGQGRPPSPHSVGYLSGGRTKRGSPKGARLQAADAGTRRLRSGPDRGSSHSKGPARVALKALTYLRQRRISLRLRLRLEASPLKGAAL